ncbi:MAG: hypothetical protein WCF27_05375 [Gaiellaceae bacterium]
MPGLGELLTRRRARSWQRWTEVDPVDDYTRRAGIVATIAGAFMFAVFALVVVGLVLLH